MTQRHLLFHRYTPWQGPVRCSTNLYAQHFLERGQAVTYMQGSAHLGRVVTRRGSYASWRRGPRWQSGAWVFTPLLALPHTRLWGRLQRHSAYWSYLTAVPSIRRQVLRRGDGPPQVIWTSPPGSSALKRLFPEAILIHQVVDYYPAFAEPGIQAVERRDYQAADHVVCVGQELADYVIGELGTSGERVSVFPQGVHNDRYRTGLPRPAEYDDFDGPIAVWVGVLSKADPGLFRAVARAPSIAGLVLIGPGAPWVDDLVREATNVRHLGTIQHERIPPYLVHADVGLMLYDRKRPEVYRGQSPLKLYEYAAAGLPILSTPHAEYGHHSPPVALIEAEADVPSALDDVLARMPALAERARAFARQNDWSERFGQAERLIDELCAAR